MSEADTLVVAAGAAWDYYGRHAAYVCQAGRSFRDTQRLAFYRRKRIESSVPTILDRRDRVPFTPYEASRLLRTKDPLDAHVDESSLLHHAPHAFSAGIRPDRFRNVAVRVRIAMKNPAKG